ncbi:hypothetical protein [Paenibacillus sp. NFR01]|uniref:hypothetical protein n=1 Tax=Paenibacillus sp. NFR01 TaxID=1566279 RepID=UPI0008BC59A8|nr:hypothetical protein [Paenibacillus sp. NFR01]SES88394.1 hypothetical protein SAMN03159358_0200 [Paenibacillus sp. NFR01]
MLHQEITLINHKMIMNEPIPEADKHCFMESILSRCKSRNDGSKDWSTKYNKAYPLQLLPTYEESQMERSKKLRLITGELPRTYLLSHHAYELEALRLLAMWKIDDVEVVKLLERTEERLADLSFDHLCGEDEWAGLSLVILRFWNTYKLQDIERMNKLLGNIIEHTFNNAQNMKKAPSYYLWLALSELADKSEIVNEVIFKHSQDLYNLFQKGWIVNPHNADRYNPIRKYIIKNALSKLPDFNYLKDAQVVMGSDGRCYGRPRP